MELEKSNKIKEISEKYGLELLVLFGSRADGSYRPDSDVDLAYARKDRLLFDEELSLGAELESLFTTSEVEVIYLNKASPIFMFEIVKKAKVLFAKTPLIFPNFFSYAIKRLRENMFLYQLKFDRLCAEYGV